MDCSRATQPYAIPKLLTTRRNVFARAWNWGVASRSHRVLCFLAGLWIINIFDLVLTLMADRQGLLHEANPLAAFVLARGPGAVCFYKAVLVAGGSAILIRYRRRLLAEFTAASLLVIYAMVAVRWKWCYQLYELTNTNNILNSELTRVGTWTTEVPAF